MTRWLGGQLMPGPACMVGVSGWDPGVAHPDRGEVTCRRCLKLTRREPVVDQLRLFDDPGPEPEEKPEQLPADVVVMDVRMPGMDGIEATRRICGRRVRLRVLILTTFDLDEYVFGAIRAGASGFRLKDSGPRFFAEAIRVVHGNEMIIAPSVTRRLISHFMPRLREPGKVPDQRATLLSRREKEVLAAIATGLSNIEIAARMYLSEGTVRTHVSHILAKLGLRDRVQAVVFAYENGLVETD